MSERYLRMEMLAGKDAMVALRNSRVAVFGIGGVGGYVVEALARCGVGTLDLIDHDTVDLTNFNRQIIALDSTIGKPKVIAAKERIHDIDPEIKVNTYQCFFLPEESDKFDFTVYDYVVDAIDTVTAKIALIMKAKECGTPIISSMGTGNRMDPTKVRIMDVYQTSGDPLAKIMRHELKKHGIRKLTVCTSEELPMKPLAEAAQQETERTGRRSVPGSTAFVPPAAGLAIASFVVRELMAENG